MSKVALVSVVIPSFNREKTIARAIKSVLNQTYQEIEVIVVDDCSLDNTEFVVNEINDKRIKFIKLSHNSGACAARNVGISIAKGDYIAFQDSDDYWHKDKLEKQIEYMETGKFDFVTCGFNRISDNESIKLGLHPNETDSGMLWCELLNNNWISTQTILCKRECFDLISFDPQIKRFQDWDLALQASRHFKIGTLNDCLVDVYMQGDSITNTVNNYDAMLAVIYKHQKDIQDHDNRMIAQYNKSLADVHRKRTQLLASKEYFISFLYSPNIKVLVCSLLSLLGFFKKYNNKQF